MIIGLKSIYDAINVLWMNVYWTQEHKIQRNGSIKTQFPAYKEYLYLEETMKDKSLFCHIVGDNIVLHEPNSNISSIRAFKQKHHSVNLWTMINSKKAVYFILTMIVLSRTQNQATKPIIMIRLQPIECADKNGGILHSPIIESFS